MEDLLVTITPGFAWVLCGQPFDVIRVRLAAQAGKYAGAIDCTRQTLATEGLFALWKGATPALLINVPYSMIMFGVYYSMRPADSGPEARDAGWYAGVFRGGLVAGIPMTLIQNPLDCWRVRCATAGAGVSGVAVLRQTLSSEPPSVLMRGFWITALRNLPGNGLYFCSYEWALGLFQRRGWLGRRGAGGDEAMRSAVVGAITGSFGTFALRKISPRPVEKSARHALCAFISPNSCMLSLSLSLSLFATLSLCP